jgi:multiple sugar transport system permease protein
VSLSLKRAGDLSDGRFVPRSITFENYRQIFDQGVFTSSLRN